MSVLALPCVMAVTPLELMPLGFGSLPPRMLEFWLALMPSELRNWMPCMIEAKVPGSMVPLKAPGSMVPLLELELMPNDLSS